MIQILAVLVFFVSAASPMLAHGQPLDYAHGGALTISGSVSGSGGSTFQVRGVAANTLLPSDPATSDIVAPVTGNYFITGTIRVCTPGSRGYVSSEIRINGTRVGVGTNRANECGSAVANAAVFVSEGDIISGVCGINQGGISGNCQMTIALLGLPYYRP